MPFGIWPIIQMILSGLAGVGGSMAGRAAIGAGVKRFAPKLAQKAGSALVGGANKAIRAVPGGARAAESKIGQAALGRLGGFPRGFGLSTVDVVAGGAGFLGAHALLGGGGEETINPEALTQQPLDIYGSQTEEGDGLSALLAELAEQVELGEANPDDIMNLAGLFGEPQQGRLI